MEKTYAISKATIIDAYNKAFQFLTVNHGTQARKDIEVMRTEVKLSQIIVKQLNTELNRIHNAVEAMSEYWARYEKEQAERNAEILDALKEVRANAEAVKKATTRRTNSINSSLLFCGFAHLFAYFQNHVSYFFSEGFQFCNLFLQRFHHLLLVLVLPYNQSY